MDACNLLNMQLELSVDSGLNAVDCDVDHPDSILYWSWAMTTTMK